MVMGAIFMNRVKFSLSVPSYAGFQGLAPDMMNKIFQAIIWNKLWNLTGSQIFVDDKSAEGGAKIVTNPMNICATYSHDIKKITRMAPIIVLRNGQAMMYQPFLHSFYQKSVSEHCIFLRSIFYNKIKHYSSMIMVFVRFDTKLQ